MTPGRRSNPPLDDVLAGHAAAVVHLLHAVQRDVGDLPPDVARLAVAVLDSLDELHDRLPPEEPEAAPGPHDPERRRHEYQLLVDGVREAVARHVPVGAVVAVVSRGDDQLVALPGRTGWHCPQTDDGVWAGHHPASGADALAHVDELRRRGARWFLVPGTAAWWLDFYAELAAFLHEQCRLVVRDPALALFELPEPSGRPAPARGRSDLAALRSLVTALLPAGSSVLVVTGGDDGYLDLGPFDCLAVGGPRDVRDPQGSFLVVPAAMLQGRDSSNFLADLPPSHRRVADQHGVGVVVEL